MGLLLATGPILKSFLQPAELSNLIFGNYVPVTDDGLSSPELTTCATLPAATRHRYPAAAPQTDRRAIRVTTPTDERKGGILSRMAGLLRRKKSWLEKDDAYTWQGYGWGIDPPPRTLAYQYFNFVLIEEAVGDRRFGRSLEVGCGWGARSPLSLALAPRPTRSIRTRTCCATPGSDSPESSSTKAERRNSPTPTTISISSCAGRCCNISPKKESSLLQKRASGCYSERACCFSSRTLGPRNRARLSGVVPKSATRNSSRRCS